MQLSDGSIAQLVRLLQLAILTGTDVTDNFRTIRFVEEEGVLHLDPEYVENFENSKFRLFDIEISTEQKIIAEQIKTDNNKKLKEAVMTLTNRQREAIYCLYYEGLSYLEIKKLMGFSNIRSVRNLIYKALNHMRSALTLVILCCYF